MNLFQFLSAVRGFTLQKPGKHKRGKHHKVGRTKKGVLKAKMRINQRKLETPRPFAVYRRVSANHPWRLLCATDNETFAVIAYDRAHARFPNQEIRLRGATA